MDELPSEEVVGTSPTPDADSACESHEAHRPSAPSDRHVHWVREGQHGSLDITLSRTSSSANGEAVADSNKVLVGVSSGGGFTPVALDEQRLSADLLSVEKSIAATAAESTSGGEESEEARDFSGDELDAGVMTERVYGSNAGNSGRTTGGDAKGRGANCGTAMQLPAAKMSPGTAPGIVSGTPLSLRSASSSWRLVSNATEEFKYMRLREKRLFLCQLSATLDAELQEVVQGILLPYLGADTVACLAGPAPNIFNRELQPFVGGEEHLLVTCRAVRKRGRGSGHHAPLPTQNELSNSLMARTSCGATLVQGPMIYQPHKHLTDSEVRPPVAARRRTPAAAPSVLELTGSVSSYASGASPVTLPQRQHPPASNVHQVLLDNSQGRGLVSFRIDKLADRDGMMAIKRKAKRAHGRTGAATVESNEYEALRLRLLKQFARMNHGDKIALVGGIFREDPYSSENVELGAFLNDCIRQRIIERPSISRLPKQLLDRILLYLPLHDACRAAGVCRDWKKILDIDTVWKTRCLRLGRQHGVVDLPAVIITGLSVTARWKLLYHRWEAKFKKLAKNQVIKQTTSKWDPLKKIAVLVDFRSAAHRLRQPDEEPDQTRADKMRFITGLVGKENMLSMTTQQVEVLLSNPLIKAEMWKDQYGSPSGKDGLPEMNLNWRLILEKANMSILGSVVGAEKIVPMPTSALEVRLEEKLGPTIEDNKLFYSSLQPPPAWSLPLSQKNLWELENRAVDCSPAVRVRQLPVPSSRGILSMCTDRRRIICGCIDSAIRVWSILSGRLVSTLCGHKGSVHCVDYHDDLIASGSFDHTCIVWNAVQQEAAQVLRGHKATVTCLSLKRSVLATGSADRTVRLWSTQSWTTLVIFDGSAIGGVADLCLRLHGDCPPWLFAACSDGSVLSWNLTEILPSSCSAHTDLSSSCGSGDLPMLKTASSRDVILRQGAPATCMKIARNLLVIGDSIGSVTLHDMRSSAAMTSLQVHNSAVLALDVSADWLFTAGQDMTIRQWSLKTGQCVRVLVGHVNAVHGIVCLDSVAVLSTSLDSTVRVWESEAPDPEDNNEARKETFAASRAAHEAEGQREESAEESAERKKQEWLEKMLDGLKNSQPKQPTKAARKEWIYFRSPYIEALAGERAAERERKKRREELIREGKLQPKLRRPKRKPLVHRTYLSGGRGIPVELIHVADYSSSPELQPEEIKKKVEIW